MPRILGIDPGSHVTGYALICGAASRATCERAGQIALGDGELTARLTLLFAQLDRVLLEAAPDCVAVESAFHARSARSSLVLGHARGVVLLAAGLRGIPLSEYAPREVKMAVVGRGGATKEQVQFMVKRLLSLEKPPRADEADAMALGLCHLHRTKLGLPRPAGRRPADEAALWRAKARP